MVMEGERMADGNCEADGMYKRKEFFFLQLLVFFFLLLLLFLPKLLQGQLTT
jgi:hypothetical protein